MNDEAVLWRYRLFGFASHLGRTVAERFVTGIVLILSLVGFIALFYTIGQYAGSYELNYRWVSIGLSFVFIAGFLGNLRPNTIQHSFVFLPISPQTLTWHNVSAGLRFPLLVGILLLVPFFAGENVNWFYSVTDLLMLAIGSLSVLTAGYFVGVMLALGIRTITRHTFIRLLAVIAVLVLAFEFLTGPNQLTSAIEQTLLEVSRTVIFLLAAGSIGVIGVAVALIEMCHPLPSEYQPHRYWTILQRTRNLRATYSQAESAFFQTILRILRSPQLHLKLILLLLTLTTFRTILSGAVPQYPSLQIALHALGLGLAAFFICFESGQFSVKKSADLFHLPLDSWRLPLGTYLAAMTVYALYISLFASSNPMHWLLTTVIAAVIGTVAFGFGRREAQAIAIVPLSWLTLLIALPTIMGVVLGTIIEQATFGEAAIVTITWCVAYLVLPLLFRSEARLPETSTVQ